MERHETSQAPPPDVPPPMEERLFTDWSSKDSPRERVTQHSQSARSVEPNITVIQTEQPTMDPEDDEVLRHILSDMTTTPSTHIQIDQIGARLVDRETNMSAVDIRPQREEIRMDIKHTHSKGIQVPTSHSDFSSHDTDIVGDSPARLCIPDVMPQLDGPTSICVRRNVQEFIQRTATIPRGGYPDESDSDSHNNRSHDEWRHSEWRRHYHDRGGRPPDRRNNQERGYSRSGRPPDREPPTNHGSPDDRGPPGNGRLPRQPGRKDHQDLLDQCILS